MLTLVLTLWAAASLAGAATFQEDFATDPLAHGWRNFGNTNLFHWNATNQNLEVTWDSSQTNSYFQLPLGTIVTRGDDFSFALDLRLDDIAAGVNPVKPTSFELAFGFQNATDAQKTNFFRGNGKKSPNLAEFDFFPDTGYGPTIWPAFWSTNSSLSYNGPADYTILGLPVGVVMRITLAYSATSQTLTTTILTDGASIGAINPVPISAKFTDFRVGTFAIESYSDANQIGNPPGSLLAHGVVDNVTVTVPPPPVQALCGVLTNGAWQVQFVSRTNWVYILERTGDFQSWTPVSAVASGTGTNLVLCDTNTLAPKAFYRVSAQRP